MRESIGGVWMVSFVVLFIVLFSGFLAVSVNYTRAFKVKNQIINIIEEYEGFTIGTVEEQDSYPNKSVKELLELENAQAASYAALLGIAYDTKQNVKCNSEQGEYQVGGYCLKKICAMGGGQVSLADRGSYYRVTTFMSFELPIIALDISIPISGETRTLYYINPKDRIKCGGG